MKGIRIPLKKWKGNRIRNSINTMYLPSHNPWQLVIAEEKVLTRNLIEEDRSHFLPLSSADHCVKYSISLRLIEVSFSTTSCSRSIDPLHRLAINYRMLCTHVFLGISHRRHVVLVVVVVSIVASRSLKHMCQVWACNYVRKERYRRHNGKIISHCALNNACFYAISSLPAPLSISTLCLLCRLVGWLVLLATN